MQIQKVNESEVELFHKIFTTVLKEGFPEYSLALINFFVKKDFSPEEVRRKVRNGDYHVLVAEEGGEIIGFLVFEKPYGGVSYCPWLGILKDVRGKGVGSALMKEWEKEVLSLGGHKLMLLTQAEKNRGFYKKCGFKEEGFEEKSWFGLDAWKFGKVIGKPNSKAIYS